MAIGVEKKVKKNSWDEKKFDRFLGVCPSVGWCHDVSQGFCDFKIRAGKLCIPTPLQIGKME
jgi:hypothetical protein